MLMFRPKGLPLVFSMPTQGTALETPQQMDSHGNERRLHTRPRGGGANYQTVTVAKKVKAANSIGVVATCFLL